MVYGLSSAANDTRGFLSWANSITMYAQFPSASGSSALYNSSIALILANSLSAVAGGISNMPLADMLAATQYYSGSPTNQVGSCTGGRCLTLGDMTYGISSVTNLTLDYEWRALSTIMYANFPSASGSNDYYNTTLAQILANALSAKAGGVNYMPLADMLAATQYYSGSPTNQVGTCTSGQCLTLGDMTYGVSTTLNSTLGYLSSTFAPLFLSPQNWHRIQLLGCQFFG